MADLTLPGTIPGLLRRCSPVIAPVSKRVRVPGRRALVEGEHLDTGLVLLADGALEDASDLRLDLADATGRAHAAWWLARHWPVGVAGKFTLLAGAMAAQHHQRAGRNVGVRFGPWATGEWLNWVSGLSDDRNVPALADLDPDDDRRLPDGSRWVDAEALRRVVLHVAGVGNG